jgi:hypothetical protein
MVANQRKERSHNIILNFFLILYFLYFIFHKKAKAIKKKKGKLNENVLEFLIERGKKGKNNKETREERSKRKGREKERRKDIRNLSLLPPLKKKACKKVAHKKTNLF